MALQRLDKLIASQGSMSRSEVKSAIQKGYVTVNGQVVRDAAIKVNAELDIITVNGQTLCYSQFIYIMMNKPAGVLSASRDPKTPTVVDLVPSELKRKNLFPAGRLDKDSVGLIILTDDGQFCHSILSPKKEIFKTYLVRLDGIVPPNAKQIFADGVVLEDGTKCLPARLHTASEGENYARVEICEGKFHQVKRMFQSIGLTVLYLKREKVGGLVLDSELKEGECKMLTQDEAQKVFFDDING